ncbi:hypothetical protein GCM10012275_20260 [Longimycelium tulufanense]|uniref:Uncharacterized protein n=1 Tax=Longimycelium tulufanense TaxID=907463 RepID=A0A8J3CBJ8_9PSEU|nr:hypothetical protein [Longimycelium tulufanense]GGM49339.1 hypothetical protein GCM10012275_20260 [Longimycelium tulufanense]
MAEQFQVEPVAEHEYLIRVDADGQPLESRFHVDPDVLQELGIADADEQQVVEYSARFLSEQQPLIAFPELVDLRDFVATYDDYPEHLRRALGR